MSDLSEAFPVTTDDLTVLSARLAAEAAAQHLLDVAHTTIDSPIGPLFLAATERGLVKIAFDTEDEDDVLATLAGRLSPRILRSSQRLDPVAEQLDDYFAGRLTTFDLPLDLTLSSGFRRQVLDHLIEVRFGHTVSYTDLAKAAGNEKASRAVGSACATNPIPIIVPCHRVLRSDGSLGGYAGGLRAKRFLLDLENPVLV